MSTALVMPSGDSEQEPQMTPESDQDQVEKDSRSFWRKLRNTPKRDLLRFRLSGRLDYRYLVASSHLPEAIQSCVIKVVNKTRLKRRERLDVAHELTTHFLDAQLQAGSDDKQISQALVSFGDQRMAAKLIRRAKLRCRPLHSKMIRRSRHAIYALMVLYVVMLGYYALGKPDPSVNYLKELNYAASLIPPEQRAYTAYPAVLVNMDRDRFKKIWYREKDTIYEPDQLLAMAERSPENIEAARQYLADYEAEIKRLYDITQYPAFGFVAKYDLNYHFWPDHKKYSQMLSAFTNNKEAEKNPELIYVTVPMLDGGRDMLNLFILKAQLAMIDRDMDGALKNWHAILRFCGQMTDLSVVGQLVQASFLEQLCVELATMQSAQLSEFNGRQLMEMAHALANPDFLRPLNLDTERIVFYDLIQNVYSGRGDHAGLAPGSFQRLVDLEQTITSIDGFTSRTYSYGNSLLPVINLLVANRSEAISKYDALMDRLQIESNRPFWGAKEDELLSDEIDDWPMMKQIRYLPIVVMMPNFSRANSRMFRTRMIRDATLLKLSLEIYRLRHSKYPDSLNAIVPRYMPSMPIDQLTGKPLNYRKHKSGYVIYSVGSDMEDNGGQSSYELVDDTKILTFSEVEEAMHYFNSVESDVASMSKEKGSKGDWILVTEGRDDAESIFRKRVESLLSDSNGSDDQQ